MSRSANGPGLPGAIGARAWTRIARVRPLLAGHTVLAGAESTVGGIETRDRGPGPGRYRGRGRDRGQGTEIIMDDSRGLARGLGLGSGGAGDPTRGHSLVPVLVRGPVLGHARDRNPGRGRAIRGAVTESAPVALAPEVDRRVAAAAAVENASGEGREVVRRM